MSIAVGDVVKQTRRLEVASHQIPTRFHPGTVSPLVPSTDCTRLITPTTGVIVQNDTVCLDYTWAAYRVLQYLRPDYTHDLTVLRYYNRTRKESQSIALCINLYLCFLRQYRDKTWALDWWYRTPDLAPGILLIAVRDINLYEMAVEADPPEGVSPNMNLQTWGEIYEKHICELEATQAPQYPKQLVNGPRQV